VKESPRILVVDDEKFVLESMRQLLESEGLRPVTVEDAEGALRVLEAGGIDAVVTDLSLPGEGGLALLRRVRDLDPNLPVVVLTGVGTVANAVAAMKEGALDFLQKPVEPEALLALLRRAIEHGELSDEVRRLRASVREWEDPIRLVGESAAIREVLRQIDVVAPTEATVLIRGESGTGKELVAHLIHARSRRARKPFVRVNCAAIPESLFESELFGHRRGAFTGATEERVGRLAEASGGTIALDEIGTFPLSAQAKMLRAIETGEYQPVGDSRTLRASLRILALTNEDLHRRAREGSFREDLYYRLNVFPISVPPLRERKEDLRLLLDHFLDRLTQREGIERKALGPGALEVLERYDWPGNVRELRNAIERAAILEPSRRIAAESLEAILEGGMFSPRNLPAGEPDGKEEAAEEDASPLDLRLRSRTDELEKSLLLEALRRTGMRKRQAARLLGIDPRNLAYYLRKHGLGSPADPSP